MRVAFVPRSTEIQPSFCRFVCLAFCVFFFFLKNTHNKITMLVVLFFSLFPGFVQTAAYSGLCWHEILFWFCIFDKNGVGIVLRLDLQLKNSKIRYFTTWKMGTKLVQVNQTVWMATYRLAFCPVNILAFVCAFVHPHTHIHTRHARTCP